jgi:hypothetical protein
MQDPATFTTQNAQDDERGSKEIKKQEQRKLNKRASEASAQRANSLHAFFLGVGLVRYCELNVSNNSMSTLCVRIPSSK